MSVLKRIFEHKAEEVAAAKLRVSLRELQDLASTQPPPLGFGNRLRQTPHPIALIAEVKKASPSKGVIRPDFDPEVVARAYADAGADALSVLTDARYFQGSPENLRICRSFTNLPLLRKDFLFDPYQVYEARAWGADAVLLIVAALDDSQLTDLQKLTWELGMDALVEVHSESEADRALAAGCRMIGVNNRDLGDFTTDLAIAERLIPMLKPHALTVAESAIETHTDVERMRVAGANAVLIGTTFCAAPDIASKVREVMAR